MVSAPDTITSHSSATRRWIAVIAWIALIYTTIPFVRLLQAWFIAHWDRELIGYAVIAVLVIAAVAVLLALRSLSSRWSPATAIWLVVIAAVYTWWAISLWRVPEEAVHLLEYGVLGVLLYRALRPQVPDASVYVVAALIGVFVGTLDEVIQWITPRRFFDFRDIFLNCGSCALALVAVWKVDGPGPQPVTARSLRRVVRSAIAAVTLFALVLSVTPTRVQRWAERFPGVSFLQSPDNEMAEYGHRHVIPGVGRIKSRFTVEQLRAEDAARADEVAAILDRYPSERYGRFLRDYPPQRDAFAHEARVHIFSRDHHLLRQAEFPEGSQDSRHHASVALRQHQMLERFFGNTLRASRYDLPATAIDGLEQQLLPDLLWDSWTSRHLITRISERALRTVLVITLLGLLALDLGLGGRGRREARPEGVPT
jgi:VanZ family protein